MMTNDKHLLLLPCSQTKRRDAGDLPAVERYDGPMYHVLRSFLRESAWPTDLSVAVLSARYGLVGGLAPIADYDQRMDRGRAAELLPQSRSALKRWSSGHRTTSILVGRDYLPALDFEYMAGLGMQSSIAEGPIGQKLHQLHDVLRGSSLQPRRSAPKPNPSRPLYLLPDWDDMLDARFDFAADSFSSPVKAERLEVHSSQILGDERLCDGVVVSLAQHFGGSSKGVLRRFAPTDVGALSPRSVRDTLGLRDDQIVFGDCGAFSYVNSELPTIGTEQALAFYDLFGFDLGASVDHLPLPSLDEVERVRRVRLTKKNAIDFITLHRARRYGFTPVGVIQATTPADYGAQVGEYAEMGYRHIAVGGLVPMGDPFILEAAKQVDAAKAKLKRDLWVHFFGIFRPRIHKVLRGFGMTSFDSATYFRKAWLRSDQNYLAADGRWYAAIRVPMTSDTRTRARLLNNERDLPLLEALEASALEALHDYGSGSGSLDRALHAVVDYDRLLKREESAAEEFAAAYRRTLEARPWEQCDCAICRDLGIDVLIFRGYNRNKRRGVHNTRMLFRAVTHDGPAPLQTHRPQLGSTNRGVTDTSAV